MRLLARRRERAQQERIRHHADILASTARMEMECGVGNWRQTIADMNELLNTLAETSRKHESETAQLVNQMRRHIARLETCIHRRELEYDRLQEEMCRQKDDAFQDGYDQATDHYARGGSFK